MKRFARIVSFLFNPLFFLFLLPYLAVFRQTNNLLAALRWQVFTSAFLGIFALLLLLGKWRGIFSDFDVSKREERPKLYLIALLLALMYLGSTLFFKGISSAISLMTFGVCVAVIAFAIVNYRLKASGHVGVASAFVLTVSFLYGEGVFFAIFWIVPLVAWSRLVLKRHTLREVVGGGALGAGITIGMLILTKILYRLPI